MSKNIIDTSKYMKQLIDIYINNEFKIKVEKDSHNMEDSCIIVAIKIFLFGK